MVSSKMRVSSEDFNINLKFYYMLKFIVKASLSNKNINSFMNLCTLVKKDNIDFFTEKFEGLIESKVPDSKKDSMYSILDGIESFLDVQIFSLALNLFIITSKTLYQNNVIMSMKFRLLRWIINNHLANKFIK